MHATKLLIKEWIFVHFFSPELGAHLNEVPKAVRT